jgi:hypothetical protein
LALRLKPLTFTQYRYVHICTQKWLNLWIFLTELFRPNSSSILLPMQKKQKTLKRASRKLLSTALRRGVEGFRQSGIRKPDSQVE